MGRGTRRRFRPWTLPAGSASLSNVTDSARIGNPAHGPPEELEGRDLPGDMNHERPAHEHRAFYKRTFAPETRIVGDGTVVAKHEVVVLSEAHRLECPVRVARGVRQRAGVVDVTINAKLVNV